jgi:integral membrane protein
MLDAWIYRHAVEQWHAGGSLYDWYANPADHLWPFTYPPFAAWALTPLTTVTQDRAFQVVMLLATPVCTAVTAWACLRALGVRRWAGAVAPWLGLVGVLTLEPVYKTMEYAQVNAVLAALVAVDLLAVPASSRWRGVLCGLAAAFKLTPAIAVVVLLVRRQWRAAATMVATASGVTLACWALSPRESARFFLQAAWDPTRAGFAEYAGNQNLKGMVARALVGDERLWTPLWAVSVVAVTVLAVLLAVRTDALRPSRQTALVPGGAAPVPGTPAPGSAAPAPAPGDPCARTGREHHPAPGGPRLPDAEGTVLLLQVGVVMGLGLLVSPISWSHHWVWCLPMVMGLTAAAWRWRSGVLGLCAATGWAVFALAMQWWFPNQNHLEAGWTALQRWAGSSYTLWALVTGVALAWEVRRRAATDRGTRPVPTRPDRGTRPVPTCPDPGEADPVPPREPLCGRPQDTP